MTLDPGAYLECLAADSQALVDLIGTGSDGGHLSRSVPACPEWTFADLAGHLGGVYSMAAQAAVGGGERPGSRTRAPADATALPAWFAERRAEVLSALADHPPETPAWTFARGAEGTVGWWRRRQAVETAVHLDDVQAALGRPRTIEAVLASDGVDEFLSEYVPIWVERHPESGLAGTLHLHATDTPGEWSLDLSAPGPSLTRDHTKADHALRGPAVSLLLWVWGRVPPGDAGIEVFGDGSVVEAWKQLRF